ncbi:MAG: FtsX-like permease family protein [Methanomicrobiales archaeon]|nr:FtsX-like permease family protein [Methanomicrobiales archaeon]
MRERIRVSAFLASRTLRRGGWRGMLLNCAIIALVFTNMILLPSIISGSVDLFMSQMRDYQSSEIVIEPMGDERFIDDVDLLLARVNRVPGVARASARYALGATLSRRSKSLSMPVVAFRPLDEVEVTKIHERMSEGDFLGAGDLGQIMIGRFVAGNEDERLDFFDSLGGARVGDSVGVVYSNGVVRDYRIKGIFTTKSYQADYTAFVTWDEMESVLGKAQDQATEVLVQTDGTATVDQVKQNLLANGVQEEVKTWREAMTLAVEQSIESFSIINTIAALVSLVIAVVVIGIMVTIKAMNQRRQIGILKAIGIRWDIIVGSYVFQVLAIATAGIILGIIATQALMAYFSAHPIVFPDGDVVPRAEVATMAVYAAWLLLASAAAGFLPAWRIARENILDAMRR